MASKPTYPIGNHPSFPQLRVYQQPNTRFLFELNNSHMGVWSAGMGAGTADVTTPPASRFFDAGQRIKITPATAAPAPATAPAPTLAPAFAPPQPSSSTSLTDILLATLLAQNGGGGMSRSERNSKYRTHPQYPAKWDQKSEGKGMPRTAPPSPVKHHSVTLEGFCVLYSIQDADHALLNAVGFLPGDQTESTLNDDLRGAGFTIFGWKCVHNANVRFKADLAAGRFD
ncbi:hypothetical protein B0H16DRAFT_1809759 [Mycena metata]|uniref:Uncharacterized protein n=1 Tax=Mycena metata TaxID=1033252 RepID=A0AAD7JEC3_9AGAR|nr:hypothetical protein B0H16DRAFT_1809759 [Mycena metata]